MKWRFWLRQNPSQSDTCASLEPLLSLYSDSMASAGETRRVESHLSACEDCRRALSWMQATHHVISKRPAALPPVDLRARIARAIAEVEPSPVSIRPVSRPVALRPAFLTAAVVAALAAFGILIEHPVPTAPPVVIAPPARVAQLSTHTSSSTSPVKTAPALRVRPAKTIHVAVTPPRTLHSAAGDRLPVTPHPIEMAHVPDVSPNETPLVKTAPLVKRLLTPMVVAHTDKPPLLAIRLHEKPRVFSINPASANKNTVEAMNIPTKLLPDTSEERVTTAPEMAPPPPAAEAIHPETTQVALVAPAAPHPVHEDVLSNVRPYLAAFKSGNAALKVYRDTSTRVQVAFVQEPFDYTPTSLAAAK